MPTMAGVVMFLSGFLPMATANLVCWHLVDDGAQPGDGQMVRDWMSWSNEPRHVLLVIAGLAILTVQFFRYGPTMGRERYATSMAFGFLASMLVASIIARWFYV